ncbi:hypothetical protein UFOVP39_51 [uncultured Caudovirales phage]|uniref:Uncharacterized protein n=1 Tax=uncultured Caudovirales phage TaxID=2100421 RepID=A0A6J5T7S9_9CAUD|nr:hypothetical protein UFOVP39_51 [uncultured Caudovirales phage]
MNKSDFIDWKRHPVTQVVFNQLASRVKELQEILGDSAGRNPIQDVEFVGAIKAYKDILNIEYEGNEETQ